MAKPSVGLVVHYVSYGTPGGEYPKACRAAIVTEVRGSDDSTAGLAVLNPSGMFFDRDVTHDEDDKAGGTWHWPERVE
jgi:hypothetical protein